MALVEHLHDPEVRAAGLEALGEDGVGIVGCGAGEEGEGVVDEGVDCGVALAEALRVVRVRREALQPIPAYPSSTVYQCCIVARIQCWQEYQLELIH